MKIGQGGDQRIAAEGFAVAPQAQRLAAAIRRSVDGALCAADGALPLVGADGAENQRPGALDAAGKFQGGGKGIVRFHFQIFAAAIGTSPATPIQDALTASAHRFERAEDHFQHIGLVDADIQEQTAVGDSVAPGGGDDAAIAR